MSKTTIDDKRPLLGEWLAAKLSLGRLSVTRLAANAGAGFSAETIYADIEYEDSGARREKHLVVRRQNEGSDLFLNSDLNVPYRTMAAIREKSSIPVPAVVGIEFDRSILGAPFLVMEKMPGRVVAQSPNYNKEGWVKDLEPARRGEVWHNALRLLAQIHKIDCRSGFEFLNQGLGAQQGLNHYLKWVEEWYLWARRDRPHPITDVALTYLKRACPKESPTALLWGDPTPSNVLFLDDLSVSAAIDWEMAALGPPEVDLAWWLFFDDLFSLGMNVARLEGLPDRNTTISWYESFLGRKAQNMDYYDVLARFRLAIVGMRAVDRQIGLGSIPATTTARTHAPIMRMLAQRLGEPQPEVGEDFFAFMAALGMH